VGIVGFVGRVGRVGVLALVLVTGCSGNPARPSAMALGQSFDLRPGERADLAAGVSLVFSDVPSDARCPIDATCVSAGEALADVLFLIRPEEPPARSISLQGYVSVNGVPIIDGQLATVPWCAGGVNRWDCRLSTGAAKSTAGARGFTIQLVDLKPQRRANTPIARAEYVGTFVVRER
jgi:hypothetical protein